MTNQLCPICDAGSLHAHTEQVDVEHMGQIGTIPSQYSVCDVCGSEQAGAADARFNKRAMIGFKKRVQGLLTGTEVRVMRKRWQLNQADAAKVFGGGAVAFSKYESDDVMQSEAMDKLLRLANDVPAALDKLMANAGVDKPVSQGGWTSTSVVVNLRERRKPVRAQVISEHKFGHIERYA